VEWTTSEQKRPQQQPLPPANTTLFVRGLPRNIDSATFESFMASYGAVNRVRVLREDRPGVNSDKVGYLFVGWLVVLDYLHPFL
jgi:RNA recognition motif-containing protein